MPESWLILETSSRVGKIGLARGGSVVRSVTLDATRHHARDLAATVDSLLKAEGLTPAALTGVMASRGPGSYTGLRVGLMSAKALAYATGCKLVAVDTFAAIARQAPPEANEVWVIADALQGLVYRQRFIRVGNEPHACDDLQIERYDDWAAGAGAAWVSGPGVNVYAGRMPVHCPIVPENEREPRVESVFVAGAKLSPVTREELFALEPLYLRGSSAEEKAKGG